LKCLFHVIFSAGLIGVIAGWGWTNITTKITSAILKVLKVEIADSRVCRRKFKSFKNYHICMSPINMGLNEATCYVSQNFTITVCYVSNNITVPHLTFNVCLQSLRLALWNKVQKGYLFDNKSSVNSNISKDVISRGLKLKL